jgi:hypothetical protein
MILTSEDPMTIDVGLLGGSPDDPPMFWARDKYHRHLQAVGCRKEQAINFILFLRKRLGLICDPSLFAVRNVYLGDN